jgi:hypothetical protein
MTVWAGSCGDTPLELSKRAAAASNPCRGATSVSRSIWVLPDCLDAWRLLAASWGFPDGLQFCVSLPDILREGGDQRFDVALDLLHLFRMVDSSSIAFRGVQFQVLELRLRQRQMHLGQASPAEVSRYECTAVHPPTADYRLFRLASLI